MFRSFPLGGFTIHTFGILVGLGFIAGISLAARRAKAAGINPDRIYELVFPWILVSGLVGARLFYVVSYWKRDFAEAPWTEPFAIWRGGLVFYGGLFLATAVAILRILWLKLPLWRVTDCLAPGVALGHVFGRLGCLINGCCYGRPSAMPWAISYPHEFAKDNTPLFPLTPVHPTQVYEGVLNLGLALGLSWFHGRRRFDGQVSALYLIGYAGIRFFVELFRGDYGVTSRPISGVFTPGQTASAVVLAAGVGLYLLCRRRPGSPLPSTTNGPAPSGGSVATIVEPK